MLNSSEGCCHRRPCKETALKKDDGGMSRLQHHPARCQMSAVRTSYVFALGALLSSGCSLASLGGVWLGCGLQHQKANCMFLIVGPTGDCWSYLLVHWQDCGNATSSIILLVMDPPPGQWGREKEDRRGKEGNRERGKTER